MAVTRSVENSVADSPPLKVAIVGKSPSSMLKAPFDDPTWEIWGLSSMAWQLPRWSRWFELHDLDEGIKRWSATGDKTYENWLAKDHGKPLYVRAAHPAAPFATAFPWQEMLAKYGSYFNNSISEMMALAHMLGATQIGLYGVDMAQSDPSNGGNGEYEHQRPSCEYMIGFLRGQGVEVTVPAESDLLKCARIYGLEQDLACNAHKNRVRKKELQERHAQVLQGKRQLEDQLHQHKIALARFEGAIEDNDYWFGRQVG